MRSAAYFPAYIIRRSHPLEHYRNDPRYYFDCNDIEVSICINDEYDRSDDVPESEKTLLESFGFCYDDDFNRAVAVFIRYISDLTPEHQRIWQAKIVRGKYWMHPDYTRSTCGDWPEGLSIFEAFVLEINHINVMCELVSKPPLFRETFGEGAKPRGFAFLLRPTVKEFQDFVSLMDKMMSDNIDKEFFKNDIEAEEKIERSDGRIEVRQKGTIRLLEEWFKKHFRPREPRHLEEMISAFKHVRKLRNRPAHALDDNKFDQGIFKEQRDLIINGFIGG